MDRIFALLTRFLYLCARACVKHNIQTPSVRGTCTRVMEFQNYVSTEEEEPSQKLYFFKINVKLFLM